MAAHESSVDPTKPATRQWLSKRQSATVEALLDAGLEALHEVGYENLSLRDVAARAGVTHTTAYTYFTSKEHLVVELNWRMLQRLDVPEPSPSDGLGTRLVEALRGTSEMFTSEPELAKAVLAALAAHDPDIIRVRDLIGLEILRRIEIAVGPDADPAVLDGALLLYSGAMLQAGLGYFTFDEVVERLGTIADRWDTPATTPATSSRR